MESFANWQADQADQFSYLGIAETRVARAKLVQAGDVIFTYVPKPIGAYSGVRLATAAGLHRSAHTRNYDIPCYTGLRTRPVMSPPRSAWLPFGEVRDYLTFGRHPGGGMRVSFREVTKADALRVYEGLCKRSPALRSDVLDAIFASSPSPGSSAVGDGVPSLDGAGAALLNKKADQI